MGHKLTVVPSRVARADREVGKVIRRCWNQLHPEHGSMEDCETGEEGGGLFGGMDIDEEEEAMASARDNLDNV